MDYQKFYTNLINRAVHEGRTKEVARFETHHIIPKSHPAEKDVLLINS